MRTESSLRSFGALFGAGEDALLAEVVVQLQGSLREIGSGPLAAVDSGKGHEGEGGEKC